MKRAIVTVLSVVSLCLPMASPAAVADSPCFECHDDLRESFASGTVHSPVSDGDCTACHEDHGDQEKLMLNDEVPTLCYGCHDEAAGKVKHSPVSDGACLDCHQVHNAADGKLLAKAVPDLCNECHDPLGGKNSVHQPVADGTCLDCHAAHDSSEAGLLAKPVSELCEECHDQPDKSGGKAPHDPVASGECGECHEVHQSDHKLLLKANYTQTRYAVYDDAEYALCFICHERKPFEDLRAVEDTEFRNGGTNLHYLHVMGKDEVNKYGMKMGKKEGMTCMGCHTAHGTAQAKLIKENLVCGPTYCYTMNFRKFEGGGSCVVGCHKPKVYKAVLDSAGQATMDGEKLSPLAQQKGKGETKPSP